MYTDDRPNLFGFASSELSQDAFICWLLSWAKDEYRMSDDPLHRTGKLLLSALLEKHGHVWDGTGSLSVLRQHRKMDVVVVVDDRIALLIEDKTNTKAHSGQLARYSQLLGKEYGERNVLPILFKTGDQSSYAEEEASGYKTFVRADFLEVLRRGLELGVQNDIYADYYAYLQGLDERVRSFARTPVSMWQGEAWRGFFSLLQHRMGEGRWDYVPNRSGGFMGFYWRFIPGEGCTRYLQLEDDLLCFKIHPDASDDRRRCRSDWHRRIIEAARNSPLRVVKPLRFGLGRYMTVATLAGDYRLTDTAGVIDIDLTIDQLRQAEAILVRAASL